MFCWVLSGAGCSVGWRFCGVLKGAGGYVGWRFYGLKVLGGGGYFGAQWTGGSVGRRFCGVKVLRVLSEAGGRLEVLWELREAEGSVGAQGGWRFCGSSGRLEVLWELREAEGSALKQKRNLGMSGDRCPHPANPTAE
ncbi:unnamed protein product [Gadus morhua 'NCC']